MRQLLQLRELILLRFPSAKHRLLCILTQDERDDVFRPDWRLIIFPARRPFDTDTTFYTQTGAQSLPLEIGVPELYDYSPIYVKMQVSRYYIRWQ